MSTDRDQLLEELRRLRRGRGLSDSDLALLGPSLRTLSGAAPDAPVREAAERLRAELDRLIDGLPDELRPFARAALNVRWEDEGAAELLEGRISRLSDLVSRDPRTVRRRINEAMDRLADAVVAEENWVEMDRQQSVSEWYVRSSRAILRLDLPNPEAVDEREIVVTGTPLSGISMPFTLPRHPDDHSDAHELQTDILFGGKFVVSQRVTDLRFDVKIQFPRVVQPGEAHRYAVIYKVPDGQKMTPHYVFVPYRRCDEFELFVRFTEQDLPDDIRRVNGRFHREIEEPQPDEEVLRPDSAGEVHVRFTNLQVGAGYGIQWRP
jgi:hypothetical protein